MINLIDVMREMPYATIEILGACLGLLCGFLWFTVRPIFVDMVMSVYYKIRRLFIKENPNNLYTLYRGTLDLTNIPKGK